MCFEVDYDGLVAWGTFIGGIGTAGAFLIAGYAFLVNAEANRSTQARLIHAHMPTPPDPFRINDNGPAHLRASNYADTVLHEDLVSYSAEDLDIDDDATVIFPTLPNLSAEFIFDIELRVFGDSEKWASFKTATLPPGDVAEFLGVLDPSHKFNAVMTFEVRFTDAVGRRWMSRSGRLVRLETRLLRWRRAAS